MTTVKDLFPTEGLLLLDVQGTTGQQLIIKTMEELLIIGAIQLGKEIIEETEVIFIQEKNQSNRHLKDYHSFFIQSIQEHYNAYNEITIRNALTPYKLLGSVRYKLGFNDNRYKFNIYESLKVVELVKSKFPFLLFS